MNHYILDENNDPKVVPLKEWGEWMQTADRSLARTIIDNSDPETFVSTVFLGVDHGYGEFSPILWETMAFTGYDPLDEFTQRYMNAERALAGHSEICRQVKEYLAKET